MLLRFHLPISTSCRWEKGCWMTQAGPTRPVPSEVLSRRDRATPTFTHRVIVRGPRLPQGDAITKGGLRDTARTRRLRCRIRRGYGFSSPRLFPPRPRECACSRALLASGDESRDRRDRLLADSLRCTMVNCKQI